MTRVSWKNLDQTILDAIAGLEEHGFKEPTIRSVYYVLGSTNVIPLTRSGYKSLDAKIVDMRKEGTIPWGFFAVKRGTSVESTPYNDPDAWALHFIRRAKDAHEDYSLPRWYAQENLVEVWVEKDGLLGATANWLADLDVTVRAPQGYGAWEFIYESLKKIQIELRRQKKQRITILYAGDLDPSGKDIPRFMEEEAIAHFEALFGFKIEFREIALTPEQVREFNLPEEPEAEEVLEKIRRDPRLPWYQARYPPDMFVELDAFYALATDAARELIRGEVEALFDDDTFAETREEEEEMKDRIRRIVRERITFRDEDDE